MVQHRQNKNVKNSVKQHNAQRTQNGEYRSNNPLDAAPKNPNYLRNVESKIKDQVRMTRTQMMYQN
jgi:hypothetical protein